MLSIVKVREKTPKKCERKHKREGAETAGFCREGAETAGFCL
jgi:hypothetical protein